MGISTILDDEYILLMATGDNKAKVVKEMISGPLCASALQLNEHATVDLDKATTSELTNQDYFIWANEEYQKINKTYGCFI